MLTPPSPFAPGRFKRMRDKTGSLPSFLDTSTESSPVPDLKRARLYSTSTSAETANDATGKFQKNLSEAFAIFKQALNDKNSLEADFDKVKNQLRLERKHVEELEKKIEKVEQEHLLMSAMKDQCEAQVKERQDEIRKFKEEKTRLVYLGVQKQEEHEHVVFALENRIKGLEKDIEVGKEGKKMEQSNLLQAEAKWLAEKGSLLNEYGKLQSEMLEKDKEINILKVKLNELDNLVEPLCKAE